MKKNHGEDIKNYTSFLLKAKIANQLSDSILSAASKLSVVILTIVTLIIVFIVVAFREAIKEAIQDPYEAQLEKIELALEGAYNKLSRAAEYTSAEDRKKIGDGYTPKQMERYKQFIKDGKYVDFILYRAKYDYWILRSDYFKAEADSEAELNLEKEMNQAADNFSELQEVRNAILREEEAKIREEEAKAAEDKANHKEYREFREKL